jgi:hypothetical protein
MSKEALVDLSMKEGFFPDAETAAQRVHAMLETLLRSELIRELPDGGSHYLADNQAQTGGVKLSNL